MTISTIPFDSKRLEEVGLEAHPDKTRIVLFKDKNRHDNWDMISFDFLGYTFRPRRCINGKGVIHPNFLPGVSNNSKKAMNRKLRSWHIQLANDKELDDLLRVFNPVLRGWYNYFGRFYATALSP